MVTAIFKGQAYLLNLQFFNFGSCTMVSTNECCTSSTAYVIQLGLAKHTLLTEQG